MLIYYGYPQIRVAIDSRADPFPPDYFAAYWHAMYGGDPKATRAFVDRYAIDTIVVAKGEMTPAILAVEGFQLVYGDYQIAVLAREHSRAP